MKDSDAAVPLSEYASVPLRNLDGSGYLRGKWANIQSATGTPAFSTTNTFNYTRHADQFEQVMGYFWVNQAQEYLQGLGFGSTLPGIVHESFTVKIDQYGGDNSYQTDKPYRIRLGKGGVDDAEDAEVIVHEYGHAVHASQVPGYGASLDAGSIGESFGDYLCGHRRSRGRRAVPVAGQGRQGVRRRTGTPSRTRANCRTAFVVSTSISSRRPEERGPLRRADLEPGAVGHPQRLLVSLGKSTAAWDTTLIDSQFRYAPDTSFSAAAQQTYLTALQRDGQAAADVVKKRFEERGIIL